MKYQALTREGLTLMYAPMPMVLRQFAVVQVAFNNGSGQTWKVRPTDFYFERADGRTLQAVNENLVIGDLFYNANYGEVVKLQAAYEKALFGNQRIRSNNGYEQRRQAALAMGPKGVKAAAAAAAIAFVEANLRPQDSTDGALFFNTGGQDLGPGRICFRSGETLFEFVSR